MKALIKRRGLADAIGFAHLDRQMDALMQRMDAQNAATLERLFRERRVSADDRWRLAIAPHDDYAYAGFMYPLALRNLSARAVVVFGVAHKARQLGLEDELLFETFTHWRAPYGDIPVSPLRERITDRLPAATYRLSDEMHSLEHSVEAKLPFLQHYDRAVQFVPILVPAMSYARMTELALPLAQSIAAIMVEDGLAWGTEIALLASTDAVHYGDEGWGGRDFAFCGTGASGYASALQHELRIMAECFEGELLPDKIERFTRYTLDHHDHREYKWTWCGRYSVPFGFLVAWHLQQLTKARPLLGTILGYATSLDHAPLKVDDLEGMGVTAPATLRHWVGYAAVGYR